MSRLFTVMTAKDSRLSSDTIRISNEASKVLGLKEGHKVAFFAGKLFMQLNVMINSNQSESDIELNSKVIRQLHLSDSGRYGITNINGNIHIGPVIGIMANYTNDKNRPFGSQSNFFSELITYGRTLGEICFVFSPDNISFQNKTILGHINVNGVWKKRVFPIPDVVYSRNAGDGAKLQIRNKLEGLGCKFINPPFIGNKWQAHKSLSHDLSLNKYLPDTRVINNFQLVKQMLDEYGVVYLKPISGSKGRNIIKVVKNRNTMSYEYYYQVNYQPYQGTAASINSLQQRLKKIMGNRSYIVQRGINLLRVDGNIADVRVLVQKDHTGQSSITGKAFRIGKKSSITSNISGGGTGERLKVVLNRYFSDLLVREKILQDIDYLALKVTQVLEENRLPIGELGIDIGIDVKGKVWFIEANPKPARRVFNLIGELSTRKVSIQKPLLYAYYLAGFSKEG